VLSTLYEAETTGEKIASTRTIPNLGFSLFSTGE
jgi:hypothetical protein